MNKAFGILGGLCLLAMVGAPAQALTLNLTEDNCTGGCGPGGGAVLATLTLTDTAAGVDFLLTPSAGFLINLNGNGLTTFSFSTNVALTAANFTGLPAGFAAVIPNANQDGFGDFTAGVADVPNIGGTLASLSFSVTGLNFNNFIPSVNGGESTFFALDILGVASGNTGLVGFVGLTINPQEENPPGTPIPGAVWLFGTVLAGGAGYGRWRKRKQSAKAV
jgi:hypothetical protein